MKYKVGDKVIVKNINWYNENKDEDGNIRYKHNTASSIFFTKYMSIFCGETLTIKCVHKDSYYMNETGSCECWTDEMIEGLSGEETKFGTASNPVEPKSNANCLTQESGHETKPEPKFNKGDCDKCSDGSCGIILDVPTITTEFVKEHGLPCPNGYIFKDESGNVINTTKIVLEKKKKEYPKTFKECCKVLGYDDGETFFALHTEEDEKLFDALYCLKICRDAYWKIAGEEMGLGKPWEPDYDSGVDKFGIICLNGVVQESNPTTNWERHLNKVFDFPTAEMRDAFKENFDSDLEVCKEFL